MSVKYIYTQVCCRNAGLCNAGCLLRVHCPASDYPGMIGKGYADLRDLP